MTEFLSNGLTPLKQALTSLTSQEILDDCAETYRRGDLRAELIEKYRKSERGDFSAMAAVLVIDQECAELDRRGDHNADLIDQERELAFTIDPCAISAARRAIRATGREPSRRAAPKLTPRREKPQRTSRLIRRNPGRARSLRMADRAKRAMMATDRREDTSTASKSILTAVCFSKKTASPWRNLPPSPKRPGCFSISRIGGEPKERGRVLHIGRSASAEWADRMGPG
jgi:hypothetical protein